MVLQNIDWKYTEKASTILERLLESLMKDEYRTQSNVEAVAFTLGRVKGMEIILEARK